MGAAIELMEAEAFFAPAPSDLFSNLMGQYSASLSSIDEVVELLNDSRRGVMRYFAELDRNDNPNPMPPFNRETAVKALDAEFWDRALKMTDVLEIMPQKRRSDWYEQIRSRQTPPFEEESVRSTIIDLLNKRHLYLGERVDGMFRALSREHVTNSPQAFYKRMIILDAITSYDMPSTDKAGYINDLRSVIARFMGEDDQISGSYELLRDARERPGEWLYVDGGAFKIRVYKKGTAHLEVHPDMAWRLNAVLASLYPGAIPESLRRKPEKAIKPKEWMEIQRPLPRAVKAVLNGGRESIRSDGSVARTLGHTSDRHVRREAEEVLASLGGAKEADGCFLFDYSVGPIIREILHSGMVPDKKTHQFYPTPDDLAQELVDWADIQDRDICCEPQAGNGDLAQLMPKDRTRCVEISELRHQILRARGFKSLNKDFLQYAEDTRERFDVIVMNPPFSDGRWQAHLQAAMKLVRPVPTGRLVAILPASAVKVEPPAGWDFEFSRVRHNRFAGASVSVVLLKATRK